MPGNSAAFDLARCVVSQRYKLIYNALWHLPYAPLDCLNDPFWLQLKQMNADGKLSPEMSRIYFSPTRPVFELYDLRNDPREFDNLAGRKEAAAIEHDLKATLQEWMIRERDFIPLPINPETKRKQK